MIIKIRLIKDKRRRTGFGRRLKYSVTGKVKYKFAELSLSYWISKAEKQEKAEYELNLLPIFEPIFVVILCIEINSCKFGQS